MYLLFADIRSGSTWLGSILNSHTEILHLNAPFHQFEDFDRDDPAKYCEEVIFKGCDLIRGFKLEYYQAITTHNDKSLLDRFGDYLSDFKIIHLMRKDLLAQVFSTLVIDQNGIWEARSQSDIRETKLEVDPEVCEERFVFFRDNKLKYNDIFKDCHFIYYEDLVSNFDNEISEILSFLGAKDTSSNSIDRFVTKKQNALPLTKAILNYDVLREHFRNTEWERYF